MSPPKCPSIPYCPVIIAPPPDAALPTSKPMYGSSSRNGPATSKSAKFTEGLSG